MFHWKNQFAVAYPWRDKEGNIAGWEVSAHVGEKSPIVVAWKKDDKSGMTGKEKADWLVNSLNSGVRFWMNKEQPITDFVDTHYKHFNAAKLKEAATSFKEFISKGNKMFVTLGGAMSTAELGISLAEMIRQEKVHAICCTGGNLEEDLYNLIAKNDYKQVPDYESLQAEEEKAILDGGHCRVTDTCIPEKEAMIALEQEALIIWKRETKPISPEDLIKALACRIVGSETIEYQGNRNDSWVVAAFEKQIPIFVPGWEDSTLGNGFAGYCLKGEVKPEVMKSGIQEMMRLSEWYRAQTEPAMAFGKNKEVGYFQIGGGIAGDFAICVVPLIKINLKKPDTRSWGWFCQISDSPVSFGSYSGASPNEKITWAKLDVDTPKFKIESDATIVAPLIFACVLGQ